MKTTIKFKSLEELIKDPNFEGYYVNENIFLYEEQKYSLNFLGESRDLLLEEYSNIDDEWCMDEYYFSPKILKQISNYDGYLPTTIKSNDGEEFTVRISKKEKKVEVSCLTFKYSEAKRFMNAMMAAEGYEPIK